MSRYLVIVFALVVAVSTNTPAQTKDANKIPAIPPREKTAQEIEAERLLNERRAHAQSLLINLATDARNFTDDTVRARALARIADALWESDRQRSRSMFRSAWDAAETADAKGQERMQEEIRQQRARNPRGGYSAVTPPSLRHEVMGLAARRDSALGEEFLNKYGEQKARETTGNKTADTRSLSGDEATRQRFNLARELASGSDLTRTLQFADPGLASIDIDSVDFLAWLRQKDAAAADRRYAAMLVNASSSPQSDANTLSLLASYIFTPHSYVTFAPNGAATGRIGVPSGPANISPELRATFFRTANAILLHPLGDQTNGSSDAQYMAIRRLIPLFEQNAPPETIAALKAQFEGLSAVASTTARNREDPFNRRDGASNNPPPDREQSLMDQRESARTATERDQINLQLALQLIDRDEQRARDYVDKIDDTELRDSARAFVDASIAWKLIGKPDIERALELVRTGELTHFQKAWLLTGTARLVGNREREKLNVLVENAVTEARRIETSDPDRPRAFFAIANVVFNFNRSGIWEAMNEAIKASNSAEQFTGEDGQIKFSLTNKEGNSGHRHGFPDFDIAGIFTKLANEDYDKAVELARALQHEAPRANAVIAIAQSVLKEKKN